MEKTEIHDRALAFFGRMTADVSHELRNRLATINEKNGLLADLLTMSSRGRPLDPGKLQELSRDVERNVRLTEQTCEDLNRFSHLADTPRSEEDLADLARLFGRLFARRARQKGWTVTAAESEALSARTHPFLLGFAVFQCLFLAMESAPAAEIVLGARRSGGRPGVRLECPALSSLLSSERPAALDSTLEMIPARLEPDAGGVTMVLEEAVE
jgi:signal transduction histidine kinase